MNEPQLAWEIDIFILWQDGQNADLSIKLNTGKVKVILSVQLGDAPPLPARHHPNAMDGLINSDRREELLLVRQLQLAGSC